VSAGRSEQGRDTTLGVVASNDYRISYPRYGVMQVKGGAPRNQILDYLIIEYIGDKSRHFQVRKVSKIGYGATLVSSPYCHAIADLRWD
jgi:hypothetical protein